MKKYQVPELQDIANSCWDYLKLHDAYWYEVTFSRKGLDVNREEEFGSAHYDKKLIWLNPVAHEDQAEHIVKTLLHECWHVFYKHGLQLKYYDETMAITMEPILFDLWESEVF